LANIRRGQRHGVIELLAPHYLQIRQLHVGCVLLSGVVFSVRGLMMLYRSPYTHLAPLRGLSYAVDSTLLCAAVLLLVVLRPSPLHQPWLQLKLLLVVAYIGLGLYALRRGKTLVARAICFGAALAVYAFTISVAIAHSPLGVLLYFRACG